MKHMMKGYVSVKTRKGVIKLKNKRIGDRKAKYLVVDMTERQKRITQLKASLCSLSIDEFVIQAINDIPVNKPESQCHSCNSDMTINNDPYDYHTNINDQDVTIKIINYPYLKCVKCGEESVDVFTGKYLEDLLHFEIVQSLRDNKKPPKTIDLNELLQM